jgi:hypothetical protein
MAGRLLDAVHMSYVQATEIVATVAAGLSTESGAGDAGRILIQN